MSGTSQKQPVAMQTLLICTVGGSPKPVIAAIGNTKPDWVIFVCSEESEPDLSGPRPRLKNPSPEPVPPDWPAFLEAPVASSATDNAVVHDSQRIEVCIESVWKELDDAVRQWLGQSDSHRVIVDITGGTKVMSAALALCARQWPCRYYYTAELAGQLRGWIKCARQWPCRYYYTGGTKRGKGNVGIVVDGSEKEFETANPWDALGYQAMEEFRLFFNAGQFAAAKLCIEEAKKRAGAKSVKNKFQALETMAAAYAHWESFEHKKALSCLERVFLDYANDMAACGEGYWRGQVKQQVRKNIEQLKRLDTAGTQPSEGLVVELAANAQRRGAEGRYDDAVARLYRCTEAIAQYRLLDQHRVNSGAVPLESVPEPLRGQWASRAEGGMLKLALQDDYTLLGALGDDLGKKFTELGMAGEKSPLSARNSSILAHGFSPITKDAFDGLLKKVEELAKAMGDGMVGAVKFPKIGG